MTRRGSRVLLALARLPGRRFPVRGWSVVSEGLHPLIGASDSETSYRTRWDVTMRLDLQDYVQRCIYYESHESEELTFLSGLLLPGDLVVDAGAHVGIFSLVAARAVGSTGEVHAFEPVPANYERLAQNVELNSFANVRLNRAALGDEIGTISLGVDHDMERTSGRRMSGYYAVGLDQRQVSAPVTTLDDYLSRTAPGRQVKLLKMDIEGFEPRALAGMRATLADHRIDVLLMEVSAYNLARHGFTVADMVGELERAGYRTYRLAALGLLSPWKYRREPSIPNRPDGASGLLRSVVYGVRDQFAGLQFNLVAVRGSHPALKRGPGLLRTAALARA